VAKIKKRFIKLTPGGLEALAREHAGLFETAGVYFKRLSGVEDMESIL
jgi:hypothetical protein